MSDRRSVPALPANIGEIRDPELQRALMPFFHAWNVRNGYAGSGDEKFLTRADIEELLANDERIVRAVKTAVGGGDDGGGGKGGGQDNRDEIRRISAAIFNDPLWIYLGERVERIGGDLDGVQVKIRHEETARIEGDNAIYQKYDMVIWGTLDNDGQGPQGGILHQLTGLSNDYAVLAQDLTQVEARITGAEQDVVTIQQEMVAFGNVDDHLSAQYTVKIDHNGYVSGFGLASSPPQMDDACNSGLPSPNFDENRPCSRFYVRADVFAVGHPDPVDENGNPITPAEPVMPFIIRDGKVYIDTAVISDASIDTAKIDWLYANQIVGGLNRIRPISVNNPRWRVPPRNADGTVNYSRVFTTEIRPEYLPSDLPDGVPADATAYIPCATVSMEVTTKGGGSHEDSFYLFIRLVNSRTGQWSQSPVVTAFTKEAGSATVTHALSEKKTDVFYLEVWVGNHHKEGEVTALTGMTMAIR